MLSKEYQCLLLSVNILSESSWLVLDRPWSQLRVFSYNNMELVKENPEKYYAFGEEIGR